MKKALICGVGGQDGAFLARLLLSKGYTVYGTSRDAQGGEFLNLRRLEIKDDIQLMSMAPEDFRSVFKTISACEPDEIYFLAGQSSVGLSFELPAETIQSFTLGALNVLEVCRMLSKNIRQYHAGSSECFGDTSGVPAIESTPFCPRSPYAVGKASAHWLVDNYREAYGLYACTGILFNHESPLRPGRFVTQKIIQAARRIASGSRETLELGRLDIVRDWGWAPEYVAAMWMMLQQSEPKDYVIATGQSYSLEAFTQEAFSQVGLDWRPHVRQMNQLYRPTDISVSAADPAKSKQQLGWSANVAMPGVVERMVKEILD